MDLISLVLQFERDRDWDQWSNSKVILVDEDELDFLKNLRHFGSIPVYIGGTGEYFDDLDPDELRNSDGLYVVDPDNDINDSSSAEEKMLIGNAAWRFYEVRDSSPSHLILPRSSWSLSDCGFKEWLKFSNWTIDLHPSSFGAKFRRIFSYSVFNKGLTEEQEELMDPVRSRIVRRGAYDNPQVLLNMGANGNLWTAHLYDCGFARNQAVYFGGHGNILPFDELHDLVLYSSVVGRDLQICHNCWNHEPLQAQIDAFDKEYEYMREEDPGFQYSAEEHNRINTFYNRIFPEFDQAH